MFLSFVCVYMFLLWSYVFFIQKQKFSIITYITAGVYFPLFLYLLYWSDLSDRTESFVFDYTVGNILIKGINFLTLPLFSRLLTTEEFGVYNVFASYEAILYVVVGLSIHSSVRSANLEFKGQIKKYTSSVSLIYLLNALILLATAVFWGNQLSKLLDFSKIEIVLLVLYSLGSSLLALYKCRIHNVISFRG